MGKVIVAALVLGLSTTAYAQKKDCNELKTEIEAKIQASGCRLDVPYHFTPWEECAGEFEKAIAFTPTKFDGVARVNVDWPETLTGRPRQAYEFWKEHLQPQKYKLKAMIVDWPGGLPGDVAFFLSWS